MIEFNPDGSIKLPGKLVKSKEENQNKLKSQRCIKVVKEVVSSKTPKRCVLRITLSDRITDNRFVDNLYKEFKDTAAVPSKIIKRNEKEFEIEIGTDFKRCTDCSSLVGKYREFLDQNVIEEKRGCTFEGMKRDFSYEDYFE
ncbi:MAG: hypothetical protein ABIA37_05340 [Candidatus Woesearchaeota archaeon]